MTEDISEARAQARHQRQLDSVEYYLGTILVGSAEQVTEAARKGGTNWYESARQVGSILDELVEDGVALRMRDGRYRVAFPTTLPVTFQTVTRPVRELVRGDVVLDTIPGGGYRVQRQEYATSITIQVDPNDTELIGLLDRPGVYNITIN